MKFSFAFVLAAFVTTLATAAEDKTAEVIHFDHAKVAALFEKGGPLLATNNFKIQAGRRVEPGEVEIHAQDTDIFYIIEGTATFVTGGTPVETRTVGDGEVRAKEIVGGNARQLTKGDVIVIPNRVPHWFKEVKGLFLYYVIKVVNPKSS
jgi:mannose-6-phosphate isomerase-like protein (cupin superfamily)